MRRRGPPERRAALTLIKTFASPCDLARELPGLMAPFMELETSLTRRLREDSLSDLVIAALRLGSERRVRAARTPRPRVIVAGGDVDALIRRGREALRGLAPAVPEKLARRWRRGVRADGR